MNEITKEIQKAMDEQRPILFTFDKKRSPGVSRIVFGVFIFGKFIAWTRSIK